MGYLGKKIAVIEEVDGLLIPSNNHATLVYVRVTLMGDQRLRHHRYADRAIEVR